LPSSETQSPASSDPDGTAEWTRITEVANKTEKTNPATAAARGVRIAPTGPLGGEVVIPSSPWKVSRAGGL
jgi:hypothetical protein